LCRDCRPPAANEDDRPDAESLRNDIGAVFRKYNEATDDTCAMRSESLQVIAARA
jgi:hypothetical protein